MKQLLAKGIWLVTVLLLVSGVRLHAQQHKVEYITDGILPKGLSASTKIDTPEDLSEELRSTLLWLYEKGHLEASFDTCRTDSGHTRCQLRPGPVYQWARLTATGVPGEIAGQARFREKLYSGRPVAPRQVARLIEGLIRHGEDHGYPFVSVRLDSLRGPPGEMRADVRMDLGPLVVYDSVLVRGDAKTSMPYLWAHIGIKPGDPYNESLVRNLDRRIRELPFVVQRERPYVEFTKERTKLFLFLNGRKASSINGILGLQPDPVTGDVGVTGDLDLRLRNALKRGEAIDLNWRSLQDRTQDLKVRFALPFVLNSPFGTDLDLKLFRRDTSFIDLNLRAAIDYQLGQGDRVSFFVNSRTSNRLGSNTVSLPGLADVRLVSYGLSLERERFDYRFNPRKGTAGRIEGSAGRKRTSKAVLGQAEDVPTVRTVQYEINGNVIQHIPFGRKSTIRLMAQGGWMINDDLHVNELYRIGGVKSLRGVDEASLFVSAYAIGTLEYRFIYEENANFFAFVEQSWWEDSREENYASDTPIGFGVGTSFETKAGIFSITYALASQFGNPISMRGAKVHFGFTSLF